MSEYADILISSNNENLKEIVKAPLLFSLEKIILSEFEKTMA